jgi:outer membrane receptor protein involved in Fe transport
MNDKYGSYASLSEMIQREVSGVLVHNKQVLIQGSRNIYGDVYPLIVLDGVYMDRLPDIPPVTVKSIEVLKSTAGAIYGYRSYGGVIIIKTKIQNN